MTGLPIEFSGDETHAHPRHTGHRWVDLILAFSAIFISAVSLYVAIEHGRTEQRLVAANSWPFMAVSYSGSDGAPIFTMGNSGVGPAKLERFQVLYRGEVVPTLDVLLERCCGLTSTAEQRRKAGQAPYYHSSISNTVFRPGDHHEVLSVQRRDDDHGLADRLAGSFTQISFKGCYCSVFDKCWTSNFLDLHPARVTACEAGPSFNDESLRRQNGG